MLVIKRIVLNGPNIVRPKKLSRLRVGYGS